MNGSMRLRLLAVVALAVSAGCSGDGSDVGPSLDRLPSGSNKVLVLDDAGRGVAAARVAIAGSIALTGRSGRGDLLANPTGRRRVTIDADNASATATDRLASLAFAAEIPGQDLPFAVFLPDTSTSAELTVSTGVALAAVTLDDTAGSGARLVLDAGTVVADTAATTTLRLAAIAREHLPGELPLAVAGVHLWTRGFWVDPPTVTFAPAASLEVPDELGLPSSAVAALYHIDAITGEWAQVSTATATSTAGRLQLDNGIASGGLYAYAVAITPPATVRGRVLDSQNRAVDAALVRVDAAKAMTDGSGRFVVAVAGALADGTARTVNVDLRGGALWLPTGRTLATPSLGVGADLDLGDILLDTLPAGNVRLQVITAGRAEPLRRIAHSALEGTTSGSVLTDARGQCTIEDVPAGFFGFLNGRLFDRNRIFVAEAIGLLPVGRRWDERELFFDDRAWVVGSRSTRTQVLDAIGGGPVRDAAVVRGATPGSGFSGTTREGGSVFVGRSFDGRATVVLHTAVGGTSITSAFTIERPNGDHLEMPVLRAPRAPGGAFDRHGTITGQLIGFVGTSDHQLRASRPLEFDEWFDQRLLGVAATGNVPVRNVTSATFRAGVALPRGHVVAVEGTTAASVFTLTGIGAVLDLEVPEGTRVARDIELRRTFTAFTAPQGFTAVDAAISIADFRYDLALRQPSGRIADVARGVGGIANVAGDAVLQLPTLDGEFSGGTWLVAMSAESPDGRLRQRSLLLFDGAAAVPTPLLGVPAITSPTDGGTVAADGFAVQFTLPAGALYATIELVNGGADTLNWTVVVPPDSQEFQFVRLPVEVTTPLLVAGRSYSLTVTAFRAADGDVLRQQDPYRELTTNWMAIGAGERSVRALSSRTIQVTAN